MVVFVIAALVGVVQRYARVVSKLSKLRICGEVSYKNWEKMREGLSKTKKAHRPVRLIIINVCNATP